MTRQTITRSLAVHNDLELGIGLIAKTRGGITTEEQRIELPFIFRNKSEIRELDTTRYTRVALHTNGPLVEYLFDITNTSADDNEDILAPIPTVPLGRWVKVVAVPPSHTNAELNSISSDVNTGVAKRPGYTVWNTDLNRPLYAVNVGAAAVWVDSAGITVATPA